MVAAALLTGCLVAGASAPAVAAAPGHSHQVTALDAPANWPPDPTQDVTPPLIPPSVSVTSAASWIEGALTARSTALGDLQDQVDGSKFFSSALQTTLDSLLQADQTGIGQLATAVADAGDLPTLQSAIDTMVVDYRVFALVQPEVTDLVQAEAQLAVAHRLEGLETSLEAAIAAERSTKAASQLNTLKTSYARLLTKVDSEDGAIVSNLVAISPDAFASSLDALSAVKVGLANAQAALQGARSALRDILIALANPNAVNGKMRLSILKLRRQAGAA